MFFWQENNKILSSIKTLTYRRERERLREEEKERETSKQIERQREGKRETDRRKERNRQRDRQKERERETCPESFGISEIYFKLIKNRKDRINHSNCECHAKKMLKGVLSCLALPFSFNSNFFSFLCCLTNKGRSYQWSQKINQFLWRKEIFFFDQIFISKQFVLSFEISIVGDGL